jgi:hypothetical protein
VRPPRRSATGAATAQASPAAPVSLEILREIVRPYTELHSGIAEVIERCDVLVAVYGTAHSYRKRCASGYYDRLCASCRRAYGMHTFLIAACPYPYRTLFAGMTCEAAIVRGIDHHSYKCGAACVPGTEYCREHLEQK